MKKSNSFNNYISLNDIYESLGDTPIRVLSFQSQEVLDILIREGIYYADPTKSRENRFYTEDIKQLNGFNPVWCFSPIGYGEETKFKFEEEDFSNGNLFDRFRCEMSITDGNLLNPKYLLEIEVPAKDIRIGLTNNVYPRAVVIPKIKCENLVGIYRLSYCDGNSANWFYPYVLFLKRYREDSLFKESFQCKR